MNIDDRLREAFADLAQRVETDLRDGPSAQDHLRRRFPGVLAPVLAVVVVAVALGVAAWIGRGQPEVEPVATEQMTTTSSVPTTTSSIEAATTVTASPEARPSQTPEDAARDGVVPELAALPLDVRVDIVDIDGMPITVEGDEGTWVLSRPSDEAEAYADGCRLGTRQGTYGVDSICTLEYGEVLLMTPDLGTILQAYPLPSYPPQWLFTTDDALYCGRQGDGALPNSMLCRVDRRTGEFTVRVFVWASGGEDYQSLELANMPGSWTADTTKQTLWGSMRIRHGDLEVGDPDADIWAIVDPVTLEIVGYPLPAPSARPGVVITSAEGIVAWTGDETRVTSDRPARAAAGLLDGGLAVDATAGDQILMLSESGDDAVVIASADPGELVTLEGVFHTLDGPVVAYLYSPKPVEGDVATYKDLLRIYNLTTGETREIGQVGGWESAGSITSYADGTWIVSAAGEGFRWYFGLDDRTGVRVDFPGPPTPDCAHDEPDCPWTPAYSSEARTWVYLDWTGVTGDPVSLVLVDADSGEETARYELGAFVVGRMQVAWPHAVVNVGTVDDGIGNALLVDLESGDVKEAPVAGWATLSPTAG